MSRNPHVEATVDTTGCSCCIACCVEPRLVNIGRAPCFFRTAFRGLSGLVWHQTRKICVYTMTPGRGLFAFQSSRSGSVLSFKAFPMPE